MSAVSFLSHPLLPLPLPRFLGQVATDWVRPVRDTGRRLAGRRKGETRVLLSLSALDGFSGALAPTGQALSVSTLLSGDFRPSAPVTSFPFVSLPQGW